MNVNSKYKEAHLIVAAIRILEYRQNAPPTLEDVAKMLAISPEEASRISRNLRSMGIVETVEKSGETRLFVSDHLRIEELSDQPEQDGLSRELEKFRQKKQNEKKSLESLKAQQEEKRRKMQQDIEQKLKNRMSDKKDDP